MGGVSTADIEHARLVMEWDDVQSRINDVLREIEDLKAQSGDTSEREDKLVDLRAALECLQDKIDSNKRPEPVNTVMNGPPVSSSSAIPVNTHSINPVIKSEQVEFRNANTEDIFDNSMVAPINSSVAGPHLTGARPPKPPYFEPGSNFIKFARRFKEHLILCGHSGGSDISTYMLSYIRCESTWEILQKISLRQEERCSIDLLIKRYSEEMFPPTQSWAFKTELMSLRQLASENLQQFIARIEEIASKVGYDCQSKKDDNCLHVLVVGARDIAVRTKLYETQLHSYREAVKLAIHTERITLAVGGEPGGFTQAQDTISAVNNSEIGQRASVTAPARTRDHSSTSTRQEGFGSENPPSHLVDNQRTGRSWNPNLVSNSFRGGMRDNDRRNTPAQSRYQPARNVGNYNNRGSRNVRPQLEGCWECGDRGHFRRNCQSRFAGNGVRYQDRGSSYHSGYGQQSGNRTYRPNNQAPLNF